MLGRFNALAALPRLKHPFYQLNRLGGPIAGLDFLWSDKSPASGGIRTVFSRLSVRELYFPLWNHHRFFFVRGEQAYVPTVRCAGAQIDT